ncbi:MAG: hypothetical protein HYX72_04920 [Acidobacteria bacterium]|nr:hypothetical protein [Acidobacteriota bacterium]
MQTTDADVYCPESILEALPRGTVVTDLDWRIRYANQLVARALRCSINELVGEHLCVVGRKVRVVDSSHELLDFLVHLTKNPPDRLEVKMVQVRIPERRSIHITVQPYCPDGAVRVGYLFTFAEYTREAEIIEMKDHFISDASHELRTPMTSIKGSLELLLGGYAGELPDSATELLGICLTAVDRLIRLINDLLDIAKIEAGEMELHLNHVRILECVNRCVRAVSSLATAHKVTIRVESSDRIPEALADRDRIEQVITNLLSNALKYSPSESCIRVRVQAPAESIVVSVIDQGPGIPPDKLNRVFDRFHQLEGAKKGTGLGLTISRALVEQHGGRIWVESEMSRGASFHFELPALPANR